MNELLGITLRRNWEYDKLCSGPRPKPHHLGAPAVNWPLTGRSDGNQRPAVAARLRPNGPSVSEADPDRLARRVCENLDEAPDIRSTAELPIA